LPDVEVVDLVSDNDLGSLAIKDEPSPQRNASTPQRIFTQEEVTSTTHQSQTTSFLPHMTAVTNGQGVHAEVIDDDEDKETLMLRIQQRKERVLLLEDEQTLIAMRKKRRQASTVPG